MKRKLNEADIPAEVEGEAVNKSASSFSSLGLDARLCQAVAKHNFSTPTPVQSKGIPLALAGKDILARSKTGSGKTAAYVLPILQSILNKKTNGKHKKLTTALILVPTRELAQQVTKAIATFSSFCTKDVRAVNLTQKVSDSVQRSLLSDFPDIVVTTPASAAHNLNNNALIVDHLAHLVIDEADLVLSYGYDEDLKVVSAAVPKGVQTFMMSATLTVEVDTLKGLFCRDPTVLDFQENASDGGGTSQYVVRCGEDDKFLLAYVVYKLKLIKGKSIIFVGDIDRCYRLKLFFEQFGIKSCILNSELPVNTRIHVVEEFNKNVYDIIIASDEHEILGEREAKASRQQDEDMEAKDQAKDADEKDSTKAGEPEEAEAPPKKRHKKSKKDKEYGISRGIDFQNVACVLNFDLPGSSKSYTHRIGRTARAGKTGMALSFVVPHTHYHKSKSTSFPTAAHDEEILEKISDHQAKAGKEVKPYHFDMKQVEAFRYRMNDALRAVTRIAIREARTREIRQELLKSEKLKRHFEENPEDLHHLRHDGELRPARVQPHLKHVPEYLMPRAGAQGIGGGGSAGERVGFVGLRKETDNRIRRARMVKRMKGKKTSKEKTRRADPLKTFNAKGRRK